MQDYINPIELLNLNSQISYSNNEIEIRKAKKRLIAEIELSDSITINFNGKELTKADCLRVIDELDDKEKRDFHLFIYQNRSLNDFLTGGDLLFFTKYQFESIYRSSEFIEFISPFFSKQYSQVLSRAFSLKQTKKLKEILSIDPIVNEKFYDSCFNSTYSLMKNLEGEIRDLNKKIENDKNVYLTKDFQELTETIKAKVKVEILNLLPPYFQTIRNNVAHSLRDLATDINNKPFENYPIAYELITLAYDIETDGLTKQTISKGYFTIKKNYESGLNKTEKDTMPSSSQSLETKKPKEENNIGPRIYLVVWFSALTIALFHHKTQLIIIGISVSYFFYRVYFFFKEPENFKKSTTLQKLHFVGLGLLGIIGFFYLYPALLFISYSIADALIGLLKKKDDEQSEDSSRLLMCLLISLLISLGVFNKYYGENILVENKNYEAPVTSTNQTASQSTDGLDTIAVNDPVVNTPPVAEEPIYIYPTVKNGNITGCSNLKSRYNKELDNRLEISCGNNSSVIVKLVNIETEKSIRYVFINKNSVYNIRNIPEGKYYLKIGYGNDWAIKKGESICEGRFTSNAFFKKGDEILDFNLVKSKRGFQVPSFSLKLDVVQTEEGMNNFNTDIINENDFYNEQ